MSSTPTTAMPAMTPWALRAELARRVTADLLGPLDGEDEVIRGYQREDGTWSSPGRVRDRYLVGMLAPKGTIASDPERDDDVGPEEGDDVGGGVQDGRTPGVVLAQSSMGLSVVVDPSVPLLRTRCRWGRYVREFETQPDGTRASIWRREPQQFVVDIPLAVGEFGPLPVNGGGVVLLGRLSRHTPAGPWMATVFLANDQEQAGRHKDGQWLFQASLAVEAVEGGAAFLGRDALFGPSVTESESERAEVARLDLQYRDVVEFAVGHGVGTEAEVSADPRRAVRVATAVILAMRSGARRRRRRERCLSWPGWSPT
jgi:hypothetical protein